MKQSMPNTNNMLAVVAILGLMSAPLFLSSCHHNSHPMERAGEKVDDAVGETKEAADDVADEIEDKAQDAKEAAKDSWDKAKEKADD